MIKRQPCGRFAEPPEHGIIGEENSTEPLW